MRKVIRALTSAVVTFTIGILVTVVWWHSFPRRVSLCTLARNPEAYDGKFVRVEALGDVISSPLSENRIIIGEPECAEFNAWASIQLDCSLRLDPKVDEFVNSTKPEIRRATMVVEGQFDQWASLGCFSPRFGIKVASVRLVSSVTTEPLPEKQYQRKRLFSPTTLLLSRFSERSLTRVRC